MATPRRALRKAETSAFDTLNAYDGDDLLVVIETPKGFQNKFAFEPSLNAFVLKGVLPAGAVFRSILVSFPRPSGKTEILSMSWY
jgi:hypothetical protein